MKLNLYPYNMWILYAAIALTVLFLVLLIGKALKTVRTLNGMKPQLDEMQNHLKMMEIKTSVVDETSKTSKERLKPLLTALPILFAINSIYKKDDSLEGVKGYGSAARTYVTNQQAEQKLIKAVAKALAKK